MAIQQPRNTRNALIQPIRVFCCLKQRLGRLPIDPVAARALATCMNAQKTSCLVFVPKFAPPFKQTPEGRKESCPGRKPGDGSESSAEPWRATEKYCDQMPTAPAGARYIQYPIRGLSPPDTIFRPIRGFAANARTAFREGNYLAGCHDKAGRRSNLQNPSMSLVSFAFSGNRVTWT
jgi:hypothetical protein